MLDLQQLCQPGERISIITRTKIVVGTVASLTYGPNLCIPEFLAKEPPFQELLDTAKGHNGPVLYLVHQPLPHGDQALVETDNDIGSAGPCPAQTSPIQALDGDVALAQEEYLPGPCTRPITILVDVVRDRGDNN